MFVEHLGFVLHGQQLDLSYWFDLLVSNMYIYIFSLSIPLCEWLTSTPFLLLVLLLDFRSCTGLVSRDKIPQVITRFYLSPHSPSTFEIVLTRFGSLTSPYVPLGHQSGSAPWLQLCNIWAS